MNDDTDKTTIKDESYFLVEIIKHTQLTFGNKLEDLWYKDKVGQTILVKKTDWDGAFYEAQTGESVLKDDCEIIVLVDDTGSMNTEQ